MTKSELERLEKLEAERNLLIALLREQELYLRYLGFDPKIVPAELHRYWSRLDYALDRITKRGIPL